MSKTIVIRGPILTQSGYGYHSRQFVHWARELKSKGFINQVYYEPTRWGDTPWILNSDDLYDKEIIEEIMNNSAPITHQADISIQIMLPNEWNDNLAKFNIGVTAGVETDIVNPSWVQSCFKMDRIIVPSQFSKSSFLNSTNDDFLKRRLEKRIKVIPESYHPSIINDELKIDDKISNLLQNIPEKSFLIFGQITGLDADSDRKNTFRAIESFITNFHNHEEQIGLVIKTNSGKNTTLDKKVTKNILNSCIQEIKSNYNIKEMNCKIFLLHGNINEKEKSILYKSDKIKALLAPTKGEGYGLPILEALLLGLPTIATNWSGHLDFAKNDFIKIPYLLEKVSNKKIDGNIFVENAKWAKPNLLAMINSINKLLHEQNDKKINERILKDYSIDNISKILSKNFEMDFNNL